MATAFHYSENSAFSPVPYEVYDYASPSNSTIEVLSPTYEYEVRPSSSLVDHWVTLHQQSYEPGFQYSLLTYPYISECLGENGFIRKRNERERMRVRNVNEGYARLRDHLPLEPTEKRLSKVETLRGAIKYIKLLESILNDDKSSESTSHNNKTQIEIKGYSCKDSPKSKESENQTVLIKQGRI